MHTYLADLNLESSVSLDPDLRPCHNLYQIKVEIQTYILIPVPSGSHKSARSYWPYKVRIGDNILYYDQMSTFTCFPGALTVNRWCHLATTYTK